MYRLVDRYNRGQHLQAWTDALTLGGLDGSGDDHGIFDLLTATMGRVRRNIETLVTALPDAGWQFESEAPLVTPGARIDDDFDQVERITGPMPAAFRAFATQVGQVNLNGHFIDLEDLILDPLVVEITPDYWIDEFRQWESDADGGWARPGPFVLEFAPDRLHKADISGGAPYGVAVPNKAVDGLVIGEHHQTTFVNYLRFCFGNAGMGGLDLLQTGDSLTNRLAEISLLLEPI